MEKIQDESRILTSLPFKKLNKKKKKVVVVSHLGRPKGIKKNELSLAPIYKSKEQLKTNVYFLWEILTKKRKVNLLI